MVLALAMLLFAQLVDPMQSQQAYTTADQNTDERLGLFTVYGGYAVTPIENCDGLAIGQNVWILPNYSMPPYLTVLAPGGDLPGCTVRVEGQMTATPCFEINGLCDVQAVPRDDQ